MKELELQFTGTGEVKGFTFSQVKALNFGYIYMVFDTFGQRWYEVFKRKENVRFGTISYPRQKAFGVWAWCEATLQDAERKLKWMDNAKKEIS